MSITVPDTCNTSNSQSVFSTTGPLNLESVKFVLAAPAKEVKSLIKLLCVELNPCRLHVVLLS